MSRRAPTLDRLDRLDRLDGFGDAPWDPEPPPAPPPSPTPGGPAPDAPVGRRVVASLVFLVVAGAVWRFWGLGAHRLNFDDSFTTMAGRLPIGKLFGYLRLHDSHPPLDYLLRAPISRATTSVWLLKLPSVLCSTAAVALFAWWMRRRGWVGVLATALMAFSAFQIAHGREVRMYPELELIGVGAAMLSESWLRTPRRWHAPAIGALTLVCLLTHVSGFLLGAGLLALAGRRTDRHAWRWRIALAGALAGWAVLWGPSFLTQTTGGHSNWIPRTTLTRMVNVFGNFVTPGAPLHLVAVVAVVAVAAGSVVLVRADRRLGRVWICCVVVPAGLAALTGAVAPVLIDRTLTVAAWGPLLAVAYLARAGARRSRVLGVAAVAGLAVLMIPSAIHTVTARSTPDVALGHLDRVAQPGDVVAIRPRVKQPELAWSIGVHAHRSTAPANVGGLANTAAITIEGGPRTTSASTGTPATGMPATGRIWLLDWNRKPIGTGFVRCAPTWTSGTSRVLCLRRAGAGAAGGAGAPGAAQAPPGARSLARIHATTSSASPAWFSAK